MRARVCVCCLKTLTKCLVYQSLCYFFAGVGEGGRERGTQQENSYKKHTVANRLPVTATLGRVKETPILECVDDVLG